MVKIKWQKNSITGNKNLSRCRLKMFRLENFEKKMIKIFSSDLVRTRVKNREGQASVKSAFLFSSRLFLQQWVDFLFDPFAIERLVRFRIALVDKTGQILELVDKIEQLKRSLIYE